MDALLTRSSKSRLLQEKKKKYEPPVPPPRVGKKQKKRDQGAAMGTRLPTITPNAKCKLRLLKLERVKDYLLMEEEWVKTQEQLKPHEERNEEDRSKVTLDLACMHERMTLDLACMHAWSPRPRRAAWEGAKGEDLP